MRTCGIGASPAAEWPDDLDPVALLVSIDHFRVFAAMKTRIALCLTAAVLAGCASRTDAPVPPAPAPAPAPPLVQVPIARPAVILPAATVDAYKRDLALHISQRSESKIYAGRPQALLRSVVVLRFALDARGKLVRSEIQRSNRDRETEATALATLRSAAPFPAPARHLLRNGRLEISETWLFNNDGRFQLRTIAEPQMDR